MERGKLDKVREGGDLQVSIVGKHLTREERGSHCLTDTGETLSGPVQETRG